MELSKKREQLKRKLDHLSTEKKQVLLPVIEEYLDLICDEETGVLPCTTRDCREIRTGDALPFKKNPLSSALCIDRGNETPVG